MVFTTRHGVTLDLERISGWRKWLEKEKDPSCHVASLADGVFFCDARSSQGTAWQSALMPLLWQISRDCTSILSSLMNRDRDSPERRAEGGGVTGCVSRQSGQGAVAAAGLFSLIGADLRGDTDSRERFLLPLPCLLACKRQENWRYRPAEPYAGEATACDRTHENPTKAPQPREAWREESGRG
jgi:hypothetical protein